MTGAARRKAEEDCSDERSILRRMSPVVALFGPDGRAQSRLFVGAERTSFRTALRSENGTSRHFVARQHSVAVGAQRTLGEQYQSSSIYGGGPTDLPDGLFEEFSV
jgi:hypothetical protein